MATNAPNYGGKGGGRRSTGGNLPNGATVGVTGGAGGLGARTAEYLGSVAKGGKSTTNSQPVSGS